MRHHIYVFLVSALITSIGASILLTMYSPIPARAQSEEAASEPTSVERVPDLPNSEQQSLFGITAVVHYPAFTDGSYQSALKHSDSFTISVSSHDYFLHDVYVDLSALGLGSSVPLSGSFGRFESAPLIVPNNVTDGIVELAAHGTSLIGERLSVTLSIRIDSLAPTGSLEASFGTTSDVPPGTIAHLAGQYSGTGSEAIIMSGTLFTVDAEGGVLESRPIDTHPLATLPSPFSTSLALPAIDPSWVRIGISLTLLDEAGNSTTVRSATFPRISTNDVLINHAQGGSTVTAPNYVPGDIPSGIGIPHTLLNDLPRGDYYAVVFFDGLSGCPTQNYQINAFRAGAYWGYGVIGSSGLYSRAWSSHGGGCIQGFHIEPGRDGDWLWGALSATGTGTAVADANGIPAFAICATEAACDAVTVSTSITPTPETHRISNVLFLPGIKGSELYEQNPLCLIPSSNCDIRLWLPLTNAVVPRLYLDSAGHSVHDVYTREGSILAHAFGSSFYDTFASAMAARASTSRSEAPWHWQAVAYDWRLSLPDITSREVIDGTRVQFDAVTTSPYLEETLRALASTSPTGKVTIVAHSNGGLVAKELLQRLGAETAAHLVDKLILVAVPQGGAPRALASLLYGEGEAIPQGGRFAGLILSAEHARTFSLNAPMAYHLLPSAVFLAAHVSPDYPLVAFGSGVLLKPLRTIFGSQISSWNELVSFALGHADARVQPTEKDLSHPSVLNSELLTYAEQEHARIDGWQTPPGIKAYEIGGTGVQTLSGVELYEQATYEHRAASSTVSYRPLFRSDGDGTVPLASAHMMNVSPGVTSYTIDLPSASDETHWYSHGNIFEVLEVERLISRIIDGSEQSFAQAGSLTLAATTEASTQEIAVFVHGSASLSVVDGSGKETRIASDTTLQQIPKSQSGTMGTVSYVLVPAHGSYTVTVSQSSSSFVTLDIERHENDRVVSRSTIASIPLAERGIARLTVNSETPGDPSYSQLNIDSDGNGSPDALAVLQEGTTVFPSPTSASPHTAISSSSIPSNKIGIQRGVIVKQNQQYLKNPINTPRSDSASSTSLSSSTIAATSSVRESSDTYDYTREVHGTNTDAIKHEDTNSTAYVSPEGTKKESWWKWLLHRVMRLCTQVWNLLTAR